MECNAMDGLRKIFRFNARVLDERTPPGFIDALKGRKAAEGGKFPARSLDVALSGEAGDLLRNQGVPFEHGAGGIVARFDSDMIERLRRGSACHELCAAVEQAFQGWSRNLYSWKVGRGRIVELGGKPKVMGILNITPDSFSDGGLFLPEEAAVAHAEKMLAAGAEIIDVGGESTRPGAEEVTAAEEIERTAGVIRCIHERTNALISIDTTKAEVASAALDAGASIINDISGLAFDGQMIPLAARRKAGVVIMHIQGRPRTMQDEPMYDDTLAEVALYLRNRAVAAMEGGIDADGIVLDPGIGFGKRFEDNLSILSGLGELRSLGFPLLLGCSRKSFLGRISRKEAEERSLETAVTSVLAAMAGIQVVRVHDVHENRLALKVTETILRESR
ncbi:MAG: dihydropteroate synthase [Planctomycetota bacterium]